MKKVYFCPTAIPHLARQKLLLEELGKYFDVHIAEYKLGNGSMAEEAVKISQFYLEDLQKVKPDLVIARADRYEVLPLAMMASYLGIPIAHIEGGDLSSVIDGKVRHSISHLADYHFPTNWDSYSRLIRMGIPTENIWNLGSLDVEFVKGVELNILRNKKYIFVAYHPIPGEDENQLEEALKKFKDYDIVRVASNSDYGRKYGAESFSPEDYVNMMKCASVCVGNSSALIKEASILGVPVIIVGDRQKGRLRPHNVLGVPCKAKAIKTAIKTQLHSYYEPDPIYYQENTAKNIAKKLKEILC